MFNDPKKDTLYMRGDHAKTSKIPREIPKHARSFYPTKNGVL